MQKDTPPLVKNVLVTQSLFFSHEYYVFRPVDSASHKEIKFQIKHGEIIEDKHNRLKQYEKDFIEKTIL